MTAAQIDNPIANKFAPVVIGRRHKYEGAVMKTSEDAQVSGLYSTDCCGVERRFKENDTLWRCPKCQALCNWELSERELASAAVTAA
jgi:hypothetical protein